MELRQLKYLIGIAEAGSVSRASQSLHVAQPALSQQISRLEDELGVKLLTRSVRGVVPTEAGIAVLAQARAILKQVEATRLVAAAADQGPAGPVTVGLPWTIRMLLGLELLREVRRQLPAVRLELIEGPSSVLTQMLAQGRVEAAVLFDPAESGGLVLQPVGVEPLLFIGPSGSLAGREGITLAEAAQFPLLLLSRPNGIRESIEQAWERCGAKVALVAEINAAGLLVEAVRDGLGYSILPSCGIDEQVRLGHLDAVPLEGGALTRTVHLATSRLHPPSPAADAVAALLCRLMRDAVAQGRWNATTVDEVAQDVRQEDP